MVTEENLLQQAVKMLTVVSAGDVGVHNGATVPELILKVLPATKKPLCKQRSRSSQLLFPITACCSHQLVLQARLLT
jgi:hypothetical protein